MQRLGQRTERLVGVLEQGAGHPGRNGGIGLCDDRLGPGGERGGDIVVSVLVRTGHGDETTVGLAPPAVGGHRENLRVFVAALGGQTRICQELRKAHGPLCFLLRRRIDSPAAQWLAP